MKLRLPHETLGSGLQLLTTAKQTEITLIPRNQADEKGKPDTMTVVPGRD